MTQDDSKTDQGPLDRFRVDRQERAASGLMAVACLLLLAGAGLLVLMLIKLAIPTLFADTEFLAYGRLRPAAMLMLVYGFGGTLTQAMAYYLIPRLVGARLPRQREALLGGIAYAGLVALGALAVLFRGPSGPELAEFPPIIDWPIAALLLLPPLLVTSMVRHRTEEGAFVSTLYVLGAVWWYPALHITGSIPGLQGVGPFLQAGLVANGMLWLAFPAAALGGAYYVLVKESGRPLFSGPLARAGFWTLAGTALLATPTRFLGGPAPNWTETVAVAAAMGLMIAALAVMTNLGQTLSGDWETARRNVVIRYLMVGATVYTLVTILTGMSGFRSVAAVVGLTTWHEGLIIGTTLVAVPALGMAFVFHAFPRTTGRDLASEEAAERGSPPPDLGRRHHGCDVPGRGTGVGDHLELGQRLGFTAQRRGGILGHACRRGPDVHGGSPGLGGGPGGDRPDGVDGPGDLRVGYGPPGRDVGAGGAPRR